MHPERGIWFYDREEVQIQGLLEWAANGSCNLGMSLSCYQTAYHGEDNLSEERVAGIIRS